MWKQIEGYEGLYEINEYGQIKNLYGKLLKPFNNNGYLRIHLTDKNKIRKKHLIHRLALFTFLPIENYEEFQVNHKDMDKTNNHISNLEWVTNLENCRHKLKLKPELRDLSKDIMSKIGKKYGAIGINASKKQIAQIDINTNEIIEIFESAREASRKYGFNYKNISQVCNGKRKTHKGYGWKFI